MLGVGSIVRGLAQPALVAEFRLNDGHRRVTSLDLITRERSEGLHPTISMIHRADLVASLAKYLPHDTFRWKQTLTQIDATDECVLTEFADGSRVMSDLLIGADGIQSVCRRFVLGNCRPRYAGYTCYRGICEAKPTLVPPGFVSEIWGRGMRFGIASLPKQRVYWWFVRLAPQGESEKDPSGRLRKLLRDWAPPVPQLLKLTPPNAIIKHDILDHEPQLPWHRGRVCLVGDAAHAVTPNFGQGGCLAIEDAVVMSRLIRGSIASGEATTEPVAAMGHIERMFASFESERFERCNWLAKKSNQLGRWGKISSGWGVALRNFLIGSAPTTWMWRMLFRPTQYDAGGL
jgi:2-polyprenyl-6-methoxyphenol hydroxylase-like FAD-dependent oxidoreductase